MGVLILLCVLAATSAPSGQDRRTEGPRPLTPADYARAERFLAPAVNPLVIGGQVSASWLPGDALWYRYQVPDGYEFILVDAAARTRRPAFDHAKLGEGRIVVRMARGVAAERAGKADAAKAA